MNSAERSVFVEELQASRDALAQAVADVSDEQAKFQPAADQWSIEGIVEHLAVTEHGMYRLITAYSEPLEVPDDGSREAALAERVRIRKLGTMPAPERVHPTGRYGSLSKALKQFLANRDRSIEYVRGCQDDLRARATNHPLGRMTCQECVGVLAVHPIRHVDQIEAVKASPGYPVQ